MQVQEVLNSMKLVSTYHGALVAFHLVSHCGFFVAIPTLLVNYFVAFNVKLVL